MTHTGPGDPDPGAQPERPESPPPTPGVEAAERASAALDAVIDETLDALEREEPAGAARSRGRDAPPAAAVDSADDDAEADGNDRRARIRSAIKALSSTVLADEAARIEAASATTAADGIGPAGAVREGGQTRSPLHWGFFGGLGVLIAYATFLALDTIRGTLILIAIAALLAIGLNPLVSMLVRNGLRRGLAVATVFIALVAVITAAVFAIIPPVISEVISFIGALPQIIADLQNNPTIQNLDQRFGVLQALRESNIVQNLGSGAAGGILSAGVTVATIFVDVLIILILTLYFLAGFPRIKAGAYRLVPASRRTRVTDLGDRVLKQMGGYLSGATIIALQAGLVAGIFAFAVGLPYPWAIALGATVLDFVPVVGPIIVGLGMTLLGFTQSLAIGIVAGVFYLCQHLFEAYWLYPRVMRRTVDISTGAVVVAILVGAALLGVTGAILAVPVAAGVILIVREVIMPIQERS